MSTQVKIQVPIDKQVRDKLEARATKLGFDSIQAYIRFWAKAEVDGREVNFGEDDWGEPPAHVVERWDHQLAGHEADRKAGKVKSFKTADEALDYLHSL